VVDLSHFHVLIVVQDVQTRENISDSLQLLKMRTTTTDSPEMAVPFFESFKVDLVVTDSASEISMFKNYPNIVIDSFEGKRPIIRDRVISTLFPPGISKDRIDDRLPINRRLSWEFSGFSRPLGGTMTNINKKGAFVATGGLLPLPGEVIMLEFGEGEESCTAMAIVRWIRPLDNNEPKGFGVEFIIKNDFFLNFIQDRSRI
jgi:hypothetical protein